jgi:hypothetical protein
MKAMFAILGVLFAVQLLAACASERFRSRQTHQTPQGPCIVTRDQDCR